MQNTDAEKIALSKRGAHMTEHLTRVHEDDIVGKRLGWNLEVIKF